MNFSLLCLALWLKIAHWLVLYHTRQKEAMIFYGLIIQEAKGTPARADVPLSFW